MHDTATWLAMARELRSLYLDDAYSTDAIDNLIANCDFVSKHYSPLEFIKLTERRIGICVIGALSLARLRKILTSPASAAVFQRHFNVDPRTILTPTQHHSTLA